MQNSTKRQIMVGLAALLVTLPCCGLGLLPISDGWRLVLVGLWLAPSLWVLVRTIRAGQRRD